MSIYVVGDTHGVQGKIGSLIVNNRLKEGDTLIVLGDFGFIFENNFAEARFLDDFQENCKFTLAFLSGNHENHPVIAEYPVETWFSGRIHRIRKNVVHMMNGEVFDFGEGIKCFVMGGAYSRDKAERESTCWLRTDFVNGRYGFTFESPEDNTFSLDENGVTVIRDIKARYDLITGIYDKLCEYVRENIPEIDMGFYRVQYSNIDKMTAFRAERIKDILYWAFYKNNTSYKPVFAEIMHSVIISKGFSGDSLRFKLLEGTWWKEELPSGDDYRNASENLKKHGMKVDYILSHTMPRHMILRMGCYPDCEDAELTGFLEWVCNECEFKKNYFGHWHIDDTIGDKHIAVLNKIHRLF